MIPAPFDYVAPTSVEEALRRARRARRRREDHGRRAEPAAGPADAAQRPRVRHRPRPDRLAARHPRRRRRHRHRRDDHRTSDVLNDALVREHALLLTKAATEVADAQIRHRGTFGGALAHADPAGDLGAAGAGAGRRVRDRRARAARGRSRPTTSSSTSSRPRSARTRSSPRSGSPSTPAGARTTRSSSGWPTSGRSSRSPRPSRPTGGTHQRGQGRADQHGLHPAARAWRGGGPGRRGATEDGVREAAEQAADGTNPPSDLNGTADYRKHLAKVLTRRAVSAAAGG